MATVSSTIEIVKYERRFIARCTTCVPARNVSPADRRSEEAAVRDAQAHALVHLEIEACPCSCHTDHRLRTPDGAVAHIKGCDHR